MPSNQGLSAALKTGLLKALQLATRDDDVVITLDADNTQPPEIILRMVNLVESGSDVVIASRHREEASVSGLSLPRPGLSLEASGLFRAALPIRGVRDYTCGFRAYRAGLLHRAFESLGAEQLLSKKGFSCMVDILLRLRRLDPIVREVPLELRYDLKRGASKMKVVRTVGATLRLMLRHRAADHFRAPNAQHGGGPRASRSHPGGPTI